MIEAQKISTYGWRRDRPDQRDRIYNLEEAVKEFHETMTIKLNGLIGYIAGQATAVPGILTPKRNGQPERSDCP